MDDARGPLVLAACGLPFEAAIADGPGVVTVCGPGPARVALGLGAALDGWTGATGWAGIVSFGCAGGLDPDLPCGTCIVATCVLTPDGTIACDPDWTRALLARLPGARAGPLAGVDAPLVTHAAKARLWRASGALAADMETHAAAQAAHRHGLPFAACRVVLDPAWRSLPSCALAGMDERGMDERSGRGGGASSAVLRALAAEPGQLGAVCVLARDAWVARRALRRARARLGGALGAPVA